MNATYEKRASHRVQLEDFQRVKDANTGKLVGYLGDISTVGIKVLCKESVPIRQTFKLHISYIYVGGQKTNTPVDVESLWERDSGELPFHEIGFKFLTLDGEAKQGIEHIIANLKARNTR